MDLHEHSLLVLKNGTPLPRLENPNDLEYWQYSCSPPWAKIPILGILDVLFDNFFFANVVLTAQCYSLETHLQI